MASKRKPQERFLYLSPTALTGFFNSPCPAQWKYDRDWERLNVEEEEYFRIGNLVHAMLEGKIRPDRYPEEKVALRFFDKLNLLRAELGFEIVEVAHQEKWEEYEIAPGVIWRMKIDLFGYIGDEPTIGDYKTGAQWEGTVLRVKGEKIAREIIPQAEAFQGPGYTKTPINRPLPEGFDRWPKRVIFMVAGYRGVPRAIEYDWSQESEDSMMRAIALVKSAFDADNFPKVKGKHCNKCPFFEKCYDIIGEQKLFRMKTHKKARR